ncbi:hypothetical protein AMTRI_Chr04g188800 [Amborella trichopoda]
MEISPALYLGTQLLHNPPSLHTKTIKLHISCTAPNANINTRRGSTFYDVLQLKSQSVSTDEIKKAFRSMALLYHPDVCPPTNREQSTVAFLELYKAYETLSDPVLREKYDHELSLMHSGFSNRKVWETQLMELHKRSENRLRRKRSNNVERET